MKNFKNLLLLALFFLSCFQAQSSAKAAFRKFATAAQKTKLPDIKTAVIIALGLANCALIYDVVNNEINYEEKIRKMLVNNIDEDSPKISETNLPYVHKWFEEFKASNPDAGFTPEIHLREIFSKDSEEGRFSWAAATQKDKYKNIKASVKYIICQHDHLEKLNIIAQKKYTSPEKLSSEDIQLLNEAEAALFHEMYHLLPEENHVHGKNGGYWGIATTGEYAETPRAYSIRNEEHSADEHAIIHGTSEQIKASAIFYAELAKYYGKNWLITDCQKVKADTKPWENEKRESLDAIIEETYQEIGPTHPTPYKRIAYFEAAYKEKKALEAKLAKETPEQNDANLRKLLERGPRRSWHSADKPSAAQLQ